ncbi:DsbA family protein [Pseudonocardia sp. DSM 110487]|uniref:DsbA family protein n=1 Tax=Pseudonocardia sp. DSM 110487 TaxID=2865833 RepID=UPI001C6A837F|nr:thioredoxin domain-containing protein [Pseudonocardia sp. DSM 110487]QYN38974.1 DsbA family protein [Pseudonocardia sp. DSM 110487]
MTSGRATRKRRAMVKQRGGPSPALLGAIAVIALFAGMVGFGVYRASASSTDATVPPSATASGVPVGSSDAPATVDLYVDFQCPACRAFEQQAGPTIDELVGSGAARVVYHPVAYLDRFSSTRYSSRSSAASGCAAEAGVFPQYAQLLFANQPPEGAAGLPEEQLIALGAQAGAGPGFAECVSSDRYAGWTAALTDEASQAGVNATPTVLVNGQEIERSVAALRAAVEGAS